MGSSLCNMLYNQCNYLDQDNISEVSGHFDYKAYPGYMGSTSESDSYILTICSIAAVVMR